MLGLIKSEWCPDAFEISFKLETDEAILFLKATKSIANYGMDLVIANMLQTYKDTVTMIGKQRPEGDRGKVVVRGQGVEIEDEMIAAVEKAHQAFIDGQPSLSVAKL